MKVINKKLFLFLFFLFVSVNAQAGEWKLKLDPKMIEYLRNSKKVVVVFGLDWNVNELLMPKYDTFYTGVLKMFKPEYEKYKEAIIQSLKDKKFEVVDLGIDPVEYQDDKYHKINLKKLVTNSLNSMKQAGADVVLFLGIQELSHDTGAKMYGDYNIEPRLQFLVLTKEGKEYWLLKNYRKVIANPWEPLPLGFQYCWIDTWFVFEVLTRAIIGKKAFDFDYIKAFLETETYDDIAKKDRSTALLFCKLLNDASQQQTCKFKVDLTFELACQSASEAAGRKNKVEPPSLMGVFNELMQNLK